VQSLKKKKGTSRKLWKRQSASSSLDAVPAALFYFSQRHAHKDAQHELLPDDVLCLRADSSHSN
ncbi:MAG: hypothetical protein WB608_07400, partial [Terracidiphilus sp.]